MSRGFRPDKGRNLFVKPLQQGSFVLVKKGLGGKKRDRVRWFRSLAARWCGKVHDSGLRRGKRRRARALREKGAAPDMRQGGSSRVQTRGGRKISAEERLRGQGPHAEGRGEARAGRTTQRERVTRQKGRKSAEVNGGREQKARGKDAADAEVGRSACRGGRRTLVEKGGSGGRARRDSANRQKAA